MKEHVCKERQVAEKLQSLYRGELTIFLDLNNGITYLQVNKEFEIPILGCPFCYKKFSYGR